MADITACHGTGCSLKENCYRYTCKKDEYLQSYFATPPLKEDGTCDHFWQLEKVKKQHGK